MNEPIEAIGSVTSARRTAAVAAVESGNRPEDASLGFLFQALNVAALAAGLFSASATIAKAGQFVRDAICEDAAGERRAALATVQAEVEAYAEELGLRIDGLRRSVDALEARLRGRMAAEEAREEVTEAEVRQTIARRRERIAAATTSFERRIESILKDRRKGVGDNG